MDDNLCALGAYFLNIDTSLIKTIKANLSTFGGTSLQILGTLAHWSSPVSSPPVLMHPY